MTNQAIITRVKVRPHPNADKLQLAIAAGMQVVVGLDTKDGELGVFFDSNLALSPEFCKENDLYPRFDESGKKVGGGFFDPKNSRVRAQSFRGEKSYGYWCPISYLAFTGYDISTLNEGDQFDTLNDIPICHKYIVPVKGGSQGQNKAKKATLRETAMMLMHYDTEQYKYQKDRIKIGDLLTITLKLHGCVEKSTIVETLEYGKITIGQIVDNKLSVHIKGMDFSANEVVYSEVVDWYFYPNDTDWYEVELENGQTLIITGNNPVWLPELKCYRAVEDLLVGDVLLVD